MSESRRLGLELVHFGWNADEYLRTGISMLNEGPTRIHPTLPLVEPGEWALCIGSEARARDRCSAGTLAPGGELRLTAC